MMLRRHALHSGDEEKKDIFAPVADLMVGVVFIFILLMIALSLNLDTEDKVPKADYDREMSEVQALQQQLQQVRQALGLEQAARQKAEAEASHLRQEIARMQASEAKLIEFVRFVRDKSIVPLMDRLSQADQTRTEILTEMRKRLSGLGVDVSVNAEAGTIALPSRNLFASGRSDPTAEGRDTILKLGEVMTDVLPCFTAERESAPGCPAQQAYSSLSAVYIEGHTDIQPYGTPTGRFRNNWDLSAGRAIEAFNLLRQQYERVRDLHNQQGQALVGVSGYADTRPADAAAADRGAPDVMDKDRRIEVRLLMATNADVVGSVLRELKQQLDRVNDLAR